MDLLGQQTTTKRGFPVVRFLDCYDVPCSLQCSSLALWPEPGTSAIWLGVDNVQPMVLASKAASVGIKTTETTGWVPFPLPSEVALNNRMHLNREQVKALIGHLQSWLDTGEFV